MAMEDKAVFGCKRRDELRVGIGIGSTNAMVDVDHGEDEADLRRREHEGS
jgi:hypothetical protein